MAKISYLLSASTYNSKELDRFARKYTHRKCKYAQSVNSIGVPAMARYLKLRVWGGSETSLLPD